MPLLSASRRLLPSSPSPPASRETLLDLPHDPDIRLFLPLKDADPRPALFVAEPLAFLKLGNGGVSDALTTAAPNLQATSLRVIVGFVCGKWGCGDLRRCAQRTGRAESAPDGPQPRGPAAGGYRLHISAAYTGGIRRVQASEQAHAAGSAATVVVVPAPPAAAVGSAEHDSAGIGAAAGHALASRPVGVGLERARRRPGHRGRGRRGRPRTPRGLVAAAPAVPRTSSQPGRWTSAPIPSRKRRIHRDVSETEAAAPA